MGKVKTDDTSKAKEVKEPEQEKKEEDEEKEEDLPVVKQLKDLDDKYLEIEREYEKEVQKLLNEYTKKQQPLLEERKKFLTAPSEEGGTATGTPTVKGFWLKAIQNHPHFEDCVQEWDEPVLEYLTDIEKYQNEEDASKGFKLTFHFLANPYFENEALTKEYTTEETNPYCGEIEVKEIKCSEIKWKTGKNVTVEIVAKKVKGGGAKKQKQKGKEKEEPRPSFFREFFRNLHPEMKLPEDAKEQARSLQEEDDEDDDADDEELMQYLMDNDHEVGTALRDNIVPFAVRWYTGEAAPEYERMDDDEDEEEEEEIEEEESSEDEPPARGKGARGKGGAKAKGKAKSSPPSGPSDAQKEECKQQ